jgi:hypothetical protein
MIVRKHATINDERVDERQSTNGKYTTIQLHIVATGSRPAVQHQQRTAGHRLRSHGVVMSQALGFRELALLDYEPTWLAMQRFTDQRKAPAGDARRDLAGGASAGIHPGAGRQGRASAAAG